MLGRLAIVLVVGAFGLAPASAAASARDVTSTHAYLEADYAVLHAVVSGWPSDEVSIRQFDSKIQAECPSVAAGSPQSEEEQKLSTEVVGTLWATIFHKNAGLIQRFAKAVSSLRWSNSAITRGVHRYTKGLHEMVALPLPDLCADVRAWVSGGFKAASSSTDRFVHHVEAVEVKELPQRLLAPYIAASDKGLAARVTYLANRYGELEFTRGESDWNALLEVLALNQ